MISRGLYNCLLRNTKESIIYNVFSYKRSIRIRCLATSFVSDFHNQSIQLSIVAGIGLEGYENINHAFAQLVGEADRLGGVHAVRIQSMWRAGGATSMRCERSSGADGTRTHERRAWRASKLQAKGRCSRWMAAAAQGTHAHASWCGNTQRRVADVDPSRWMRRGSPTAQCLTMSPILTLRGEGTAALRT